MYAHLIPDKWLQVFLREPQIVAAYRIFWDTSDITDGGRVEAGQLRVYEIVSSTSALGEQCPHPDTTSETGYR